MQLAKILEPGEFGVRGELWQGSFPDADVGQVPTPYLILNMAHDADGTYPVSAERTKVMFCRYGIPDDPSGVLSDECLLGLVDALVTLLQAGFNVLVHCLAGQSRSGYVVVAVLTRLSGAPIEQNLQWVKERHEHVMVREHFWSHLQRLDARLRQR